MPLDYRTVDTRTLAGLRKAERLHTSGWKVIRTGLWLVWFERKRPPKWVRNTGKEQTR